MPKPKTLTKAVPALPVSALAPADTTRAAAALALWVQQVRARLVEMFDSARELNEYVRDNPDSELKRLLNGRSLFPLVQALEVADQHAASIELKPDGPLVDPLDAA